MQCIGSILIKEPPIAWKAHKGFGRRSFNPLYKERECYQYYIQKQWPRDPLDGPVYIKVIYYMAMPKSFSKKKRQDAIEAKIYPVTRPDLDNLNKFLLDCLKGFVMTDDSQVVSLDAQKLFGDVGFTLINVYDFSSVY